MNRTANFWHLGHNNYKYTHSLIVILAIFMVIGISFQSCSKEDKSDEELIQVLMSNKWTSGDFSFDYSTNIHAWVDVYHDYLYFTSDHSGVLYWVNKDYDSALGNSTSRNYELFEYSVNGNGVELRFNIGGYITRVFYYYRNGYLTTRGGDIIYAPSKLTQSDKDFASSLGPQSNTSGNITYTIDNKTHTLTISGSGDMSNYTIGTQPWKDLVFYKVIIEKGVTSIGDYAFSRMVNITDIELSSTITRIGKEAFSRSSIESIEIPANVEVIDEGAFINCTYLKYVEFIVSVYMNPKLKKIGDCAFQGCKIIGDINQPTLSWINLPYTVESIGKYAFQGSYKNVFIGENIKYIGVSAFVTTSSSGNLHIKAANPPEAGVFVTSNDGGWNLEVPIVSNYRNKSPWKNFKSINEY